MNADETKRRSKFLSLVLRHDPGSVGLSIDLDGGWVEVKALLTALASKDPGFDRTALDYVVGNNNKNRFEFSADGTKIRASQGHSIPVLLEYEPRIPPRILFHGTTGKFLDSIFEKGILKMNRHHVHLSPDPITARDVASRRGSPVILTVNALDLHNEGHCFYLSTNGVWLIETVPPGFFQIGDKK